MQDFVTLIDAGPSFLLARGAECIVEVADDASILEMQLGREMKLNRHPADERRCWFRRAMPQLRHEARFQTAQRIFMPRLIGNGAHAYHLPAPVENAGVSQSRSCAK
jgi:hypothetical protein